MTADEIRAFDLHEYDTEFSQALLLKEIAAQLSQLNDLISLFLRR